jgi:hypothetical protein
MSLMVVYPIQILILLRYYKMFSRYLELLYKIYDVIFQN